MQLNEVCCLISLPDRILLCRAPNRRIANAVNFAILDTQVVQTTQKLRTALETQKGWTVVEQSTLDLIATERPTDITVDKARRAPLIRDAFVSLTWFEQHVRRMYDGGSSIDAEDLALYQMDGTSAWPEAYAEATGVSVEEARAQLQLDASAVQSMVLRARALWWKFAPQAAQIKTPEDLNAFRSALNVEVFRRADL